MNEQLITELKNHISAMLARQQELAQEARDRQIEADTVASAANQLEALLAKWCVPSSASFFQIFHDLPVPLLLLNSDGACLHANSAAQSLTGISDSVPALPVWLRDGLLAFLRSGATEQSFELATVNGDSESVYQTVFKRSETLRDAVIVSVVHDVSRYKAIEKALRISEERFRTLAEHQSDLVVKIDQNGLIQFASPSFSTLIGRPESEVHNQPLLPLIAGDQHEQMLEKLHSAACNTIPCVEEFTTQWRDGTRQFGWTFKGVTAQEGGSNGFICIGRDITEQKKAEQNIRQLAYYDGLTGLPNRVLLHDRLLQTLSQARRNDWKTGVLFIDLDRFKTINDTLGHLAGDELLKQVAQRLRENVRDADTVARQGGDEFVVILHALEQSRDAATVAAKILATLSQPFQINGQSLYSGASIGIAMFPDDGQDADLLLKHADLAMYLAKESGRGKFKFFSQELNERLRERLIMETALRRAIEQNQLFLQYQPQFNIKSHRLTGMEAFVRWNHPELGLLMPGRFLPLAEETGLIIPLGEWVLKAACAQAMDWQFSGRAPVPVSVNLSPRQFSHPDLPDQVAHALSASGLPAACLELEFTEQSLIEYEDDATAILEGLKERGLQLAIDDFGTGYSSLAHLKRFPINRIKIDRSFIQAIGQNADDAAIAEAIISVGQRLRLQVVAEGVERPEQRDFLYARGCDEMQGNYFSRPLSSADLLQSGWLQLDAGHA